MGDILSGVMGYILSGVIGDILSGVIGDILSGVIRDILRSFTFSHFEFTCKIIFAYDPGLDMW